MPPHLHPRSTATSTLFAGTLLASFIIVGIPHVFPCPRPRRQYLDVDSPRPTDAETQPSPKQSSTERRSSRPGERDLNNEAAVLKMLQEEARRLEKEARECPVPKPRGWMGRMLGFEGTTNTVQQQRGKESGS